MQTTSTAVIFLLITSLACADSKRSVKTNMGCLIFAYLAAQDYHAQQQLDLDREEKQQLLSFAVIKDIEEYKYFRKALRSWDGQDKGVDACYRKIEKERPFVQAWNKKMLQRVDDVLVDSKRKHQYRQLLSQMMLRFADFDGLLSLHGIQLELSEYKRMHKLIDERLTKSTVGTEQRFFYRAAMKLLAKHVADDVLQQMAGKEFAFTKVSSSGPEYPIKTRFDTGSLELLSMPEVVIELGLSADQLTAIVNMRKKMRALVDEEAAVRAAAVQRDPRELAARAAEWNKELHQSIDAILTKEERRRLRELVFQYHICSDEPVKAFYAFEEDCPESVWRDTDWNFVRAEAFYAKQAHALKGGFDIFSEVVGKTRAQRLCGQLLLSPSPHTLTDPDKDNEIVTRILVEFGLDRLPKSVNPRRTRP